MKCIGRSKSNIFKQCSYKCINNTLYCSKHQNCSINIYEDLYSSVEIINFINIYINTTNYKFNKNDKILIKYILYIYSYKFDITLNVTSSINFFKEFIDKNKYYFININKIIYLQSIFRKIYINKLNLLRGPALYKRNLSTNETDFYTFEKIDNIPFKYFFSYNENQSIYSFDIRSFKLLTQQTQILNPYNRNIISVNILNNALKLIKYLKLNNIFIEYEKDILTEEQQLNERIINTFQKIDTHGYNTDITWFSSLNINKLKKFWINLEDIWNYRCNLSTNDKKKIIQNIIPFIKIKQINKFNINNKTMLQYTILDDINIFISNGIDPPSSNTGCLYVLTALSEVNLQCLESMPWLSQQWS